MGCLKLTHNQQPELRVVHAKKGVTSNYRTKSACSSYPFGMALPGRSYNFSDQSHAFQGAFARRDHDTRWDEFLLRNYDARIGQFLSVDPFLQYASPYVAMGNNPLSVVDPTGGLGMDLSPEVGPIEHRDYDYNWEIAFELVYGFGMNMYEARLLAMSSGVRGLHIAREMAAFGYEWKEGSGWGFWKKANFKDAQRHVPFRGLDKMNVLSTVTVGEQWVEVYNPLPSNDKHGSGWLSYVPLIGSARDAWQDFQKGSYGWGTFNAAMAVTDVFPIKAAAVAVGKIAFKTAFKTAGRTAAKSSKILNTTEKQLQKKFKHAEDFGVTGSFSKANATRFNSAINQHINSPGIKTIQGTYRGNPVTHYLNPNTGMNVISNPNGIFLSGWRLNPAQLQNVLQHGGL